MIESQMNHEAGQAVPVIKLYTKTRESQGDHVVTELGGHVIRFDVHSGQTWVLVNSGDSFSWDTVNDSKVFG